MDRFGPAEKAKTTKDLNALFHQATVEIFTLKSVQMDPVIPSGWGEGNEVTESWTKNVELHWSPTNGVTLTNPDPMTSAQFLTSIYVPKEKLQGVSEAIHEMKQLGSRSQPEVDVSARTETIHATNSSAAKIEADSSTLATEAASNAADVVSSPQSIEDASSGIQKDISNLREQYLNHAIESSERTLNDLRKQLREHITLKSGAEITVIDTQSKTKALYKKILLTDPNTKLAVSQSPISLPLQNTHILTHPL